MSDLFNDPELLAGYTEAVRQSKFTDTAANKKAFMEAGLATRAKERARCFAIIDSPEAAFRDKQALHIACKTDMTAEAARTHLDTLPADPQTNAENASAGFAATIAAARGTTSQSTSAATGLGASLASLGRRH